MIAHELASRLVALACALLAPATHLHLQRGAARALFEVARDRWARGDETSALEAVEAALPFLAPDADPDVEISAGRLLADLGRLDAARGALAAAADACARRGDERGLSAALTELCRVSREQGRYAQALSDGRRARDVALAHGPGDRSARARVELARVWLELYDFSQARAELDQAEVEARLAGARAAAALARAGIGAACALVSDWNGAQRILEAEIPALVALGERDAAVEFTLPLAQALRRTSALDEARRRLDALPPDARGVSTLLRSQWKIEHACWLHAHGDTRAGVDALEGAIADARARGQRAVELQARSKQARFWLDLDEPSRAAESSCAALGGVLEIAAGLTRDEARELRGKVRAATGTALSAIDAALARDRAPDARARRVREAFWVTELSRGETLAEPIELARLQELLPSDMAYVAYVRWLRAAAIVVRRDDARLVVLGDANAAHDDGVRHANLLLSDASAELDLSTRLYEDLVRPLEPALSGARCVALSLDKFIASVAFEALVRGQGPGARRWIERVQIGYVPCAGSLARRIESPAPPDLRAPWVAIANPASGGDRPPLLESDAEVREIAAILSPSETLVLSGARASLSALTSALSSTNRRCFAAHFACHGELGADRDGSPRLVLAGRDRLDASAIAALPLDVDLVVVSACHGGGGRFVRGAGPASLAMDFQAAGVPRVVVATRAIEDAESRRFVVDFYRRMRLDRLSPGEALRRAKLAMIDAGGNGAHPHHWAAFAMWGAPE